MKTPRLTWRAKADLDQIWEDVARHNEKAATKLIAAIQRKARIHARFPGMGRARDDLRPGLRSFVHRPYVIFFHVVDRTIEIVRVLHGSRDISAGMIGNGE